MTQHFLHTLGNGTNVLAAGLVPLNNLTVDSRWMRRSAVANSENDSGVNTMIVKNITNGMVTYSTDTRNITESWAQFQYKWIMIVDALPNWCND